MNTVLSMIYEIVFDSMHDDALCSIALYTVTNPEEVCTMSVQKLAEACFVSSGSVLKFCQTLGISSFSLFKKTLRSTIETRRMQLAEKYKMLSVENLKEKMNVFVTSEKMVNELVFHAHQFAKHIQTGRRIHLYGAAFPLALSLSFAEDACVLGYPVYFHQGFENCETLKSQDGVHALITFSGRWIESAYDACATISRCHERFFLITSSDRTLPNVMEKIRLPRLCSNEYMNVLYLLFLDLVLLELLRLAG